MSTDPHFDVLIAGGGLVGLTLGIALAQGGLETAVVDTLAPETATQAGFDGRVSAIAYASCRMFEVLGLWPHLQEHAQPILDIVVSDGTVEKGASPLFLHFDHTEIGVPLGHLIENRHTRLAQQAVVEETRHLTQIAPARVAGLETLPGFVRAQLQDGRQLTALVCVAADGRGSPLRELMGIKSIGWSCRQHGIVTTVAHERPHQGIAQEYFLPSGPFAILPMAGHRSSLVWTEREDIAPGMMALSDDDFAHQVRLRFTDYLGEVRPVGPRWSYPLTLNLARRYTAPRFVLAGDAAHGVHPIAGQGFNLGLRDVAALAEVLINAARLGRDIGAPDVLSDYEKWRRFDNTLMGLSMDALNTLFSNDIGPLRLARDLGLALTDRLPPVRRFFMRLAGGDIGALPRLLKGEAI